MSLETLSSTQLPIILASMKDDPQDIMVALYKDSNDNKILTNATYAPLSPISGEKMKQVSAKEKVSASEIDSFPVIGSCDNCDCQLHGSAELALDMLDKEDFKCVVCGTQVTINPELEQAKLEEAKIAETAAYKEIAESDEDLNTEESDLDDDELELAFDPEEDEELAASKKKDCDDDDDYDYDSSGSSSDSSGDDDSEEAGILDEIEHLIAACRTKKKKEQKQEKEESSEENPVTETVVEPKPADAPVVEVKPEGETEAVKADADEVKPADAPVAELPKTEEIKTDAPVVEPIKTETEVKTESNPVTVEILPLAASVNWQDSELDVVLSSLKDPTYYVFSNGKPVATLAKSRAAEDLQEVFSSNAFIKGFLAATRQGLTAQDETNFGLAPITTEVPIEQVQKDKIDQAIEKTTEELKAEFEQHKIAHKQSFNTSLMASLKGVWKDYNNPLKDSLIANLKVNGVHNPESLINKIFADTAVDTFKAVLVKTDDLLNKPEASRDEIARLVETAAFRNSDNVATTEKEINLTEGGKAVLAGTTNENTVVASKSGDDNVAAIRRKLRLS